jgi:hypothetical protein
VGEYDLSVSLAVKNIPTCIANSPSEAMQAGLQQSMKKLPDESDEQFADRQRWPKARSVQIRSSSTKSTP